MISSGSSAPPGVAPGIFRHRTQQGIDQLKSIGFNVRMAPHALSHQGYVSDTAANRAQDINELFADPEIKAIIASIGGDHSCHLLPLLDFDLIARNPKIFMGFSDITVLNVAIWQQTGLITFNGPALLTDFAEYPTHAGLHRRILPESACHWVAGGGRVTFTGLDGGVLGSFQGGVPRRMLPNPGWTWLKPGLGEGKLIGGCIEILATPARHTLLAELGGCHPVLRDLRGQALDPKRWMAS